MKTKYCEEYRIGISHVVVITNEYTEEQITIDKGTYDALCTYTYGQYKPSYQCIKDYMKEVGR